MNTIFQVRFGEYSILNRMHTYRILGKASWGIVIRVDAEVIDGRTLNSVYIHDNVYIDTSGLGFFSNEEKAQIRKGVNWVAHYLKNTEDITIRFNSVGINPCDYQEEGLFFAAANWLSKEFNFDLPSYSVVFNKHDNKYEFTLG